MSTNKRALPKARKKNLVLMERDIQALMELNQHRAISSSQLAKLCFSNISYETARKRLRKLQQSGYMGSTVSERLEGRGRPELIYFLTTSGAKALEQHKGISWETVPTGPPHTYHKEHFLQLVDIRLALNEAEHKKFIANLEWVVGQEFWRELSSNSTNANEQADATIKFQYPSLSAIRILLEIDTGNFRQTKHWEPKIKAFLKTGYPIWVIANNEARIATLRKWTAPLLEQASVGPGKCVFAVYSDIVAKGIFGATWLRTDGSITDLRPKTKTI